MAARARRPRIFCNRTLNLRSIKAIGYDMDYTLIHYRTRDWEERAYHHVKRRLAEKGWPVGDLSFAPELAIRGLIIDTELGNMVKANRFGFVKRAFHGTQPVAYEDLRALYSRVIVDLAEPRWRFMNTLFSISEAVIYMQLVDLLDAGALPHGTGYDDLYRLVRRTLDQAHIEGTLKGEIVSNPERFVELEEDVALSLLDQYHAGRKLLLITNSEWHYTRAMMSYAFDRFLPRGMAWRDLFELVVVEARKPTFFTAENPVFEVVNEDGLLKPAYEGMAPNRSFLGGNAGLVEKCLGLSGDQILYVGDHIFSDVHVSKNIQRWRTALVLRELEGELEAVEGFTEQQARLEHMMAEKEMLEAKWCRLRLSQQRIEKGYGGETRDLGAVHEELTELRQAVMELDAKIGAYARASSELGSSTWGLLMRAGNDKSHLARQVERYADIYMARVSDFGIHTPFAYLRSARGNLPHDPVSKI